MKIHQIFFRNRRDEFNLCVGHANYVIIPKGEIPPIGLGIYSKRFGKKIIWADEPLTNNDIKKIKKDLTK